MSNNTGGPAFPQPTYTTLSWQGMTLRDYFAAKALQGMIGGGWHREGRTPEPEEFAARSYDYADAMLSARGTEKERDNNE